MACRIYVGSEARAVPVKSETRKRKGKKTREKPYAIKRRLDDAEAKKIATRPRLPTTSQRTRSPRRPKPPHQNPIPEPEPRASQDLRGPQDTPTKMTTPSKIPTGKNHKHPTQPANPDATTSKYGVVVHGIALRKDLGRIRRWLEEGNPELGKTIGIRWLRKKTLLLEEGKKTSSVVVYLEGGASAEKALISMIKGQPDATTRGKHGIVIHGIALRKDLGKVKAWLEAANRDLGKDNRYSLAEEEDDFGRGGQEDEFSGGLSGQGHGG
ncbi:hypothetical protein BDZ91DRAFT_853675 [Kalaharituber pfeilii]|nr:hypothetical protein BDZ91DRAFT_853675 [Kalaharituber pfeilii]